VRPEDRPKTEVSEGRYSVLLDLHFSMIITYIFG
jgi:hypothetical protein